MTKAKTHTHSLNLPVMVNYSQQNLIMIWSTKFYYISTDWYWSLGQCCCQWLHPGECNPPTAQLIMLNQWKRFSLVLTQWTIELSPRTPAARRRFLEWTPDTAHPPSSVMLDAYPKCIFNKWFELFGISNY